MRPGDIHSTWEVLIDIDNKHYFRPNIPLKIAVKRLEN